MTWPSSVVPVMFSILYSLIYFAMLCLVHPIPYDVISLLIEFQVTYQHSQNLTSQGALLAAGLMGAVSAGLVPVVKVKKAA